MVNADKVLLDDYNTFCRNLKEGCILYNVDSTNAWGNYLLVANIIPIDNTYTVLLIGLKKEDGKFKTRDIKINLTPDYAKNTPFLKYVGLCEFQLIPVLSKINVNQALVTVYGSTDLRKFNKKADLRKPRVRRYDKAGTPVIKTTKNV